MNISELKLNKIQKYESTMKKGSNFLSFDCQWSLYFMQTSIHSLLLLAS